MSFANHPDSSTGIDDTAHAAARAGSTPASPTPDTVRHVRGGLR
ncbi:hypothetical protein I552_8987 [Mycobacterium xenopi 3993]|nr:hypothetical protein I552_8987 [Mycobacterium xenopi 3993]